MRLGKCAWSAVICEDDNFYPNYLIFVYLTIILVELFLEEMFYFKHHIGMHIPSQLTTNNELWVTGWAENITKYIINMIYEILPKYS